MSLRRFPWKAPRITDNSFKLFTSPPNNGTSTDGTIKERSKSATEISPAVSDDRRSSASRDQRHQHHHHHHTEKPDGTDTDKAQDPGPRIDAPKAEVIKGPWRLLRLLPRETRTIIGRMLQLDPRQRATIEELQNDPWMSGTPFCQQIEGGEVIRVPGHEHTLEPGTVTTPAASHK